MLASVSRRLADTIFCDVFVVVVDDDDNDDDDDDEYGDESRSPHQRVVLIGAGIAFPVNRPDFLRCCC